MRKSTKGVHLALKVEAVEYDGTWTATELWSHARVFGDDCGECIALGIINTPFTGEHT